MQLADMEWDTLHHASDIELSSNCLTSTKVSSSAPSTLRGTMLYTGAHDVQQAGWRTCKRAVAHMQRYAAAWPSSCGMDRSLRAEADALLGQCAVALLRQGTVREVYVCLCVCVHMIDSTWTSILPCSAILVHAGSGVHEFHVILDALGPDGVWVGVAPPDVDPLCTVGDVGCGWALHSDGDKRSGAREEEFTQVRACVRVCVVAHFVQVRGAGSAQSACV